MGGIVGLEFVRVGNVLELDEVFGLPLEGGVDVVGGGHCHDRDVVEGASAR